MTRNEKDALLFYLESRLLDMAAHSTGSQCCLHMAIYDIMSDMEDSLEAQVEFAEAQEKA